MHAAEQWALRECPDISWLCILVKFILRHLSLCNLHTLPHAPGFHPEHSLLKLRCFCSPRILYFNKLSSLSMKEKKKKKVLPHYTDVLSFKMHLKFQRCLDMSYAYMGEVGINYLNCLGKEMNFYQEIIYIVDEHFVHIADKLPQKCLCFLNCCFQINCSVHELCKH